MGKFVGFSVVLFVLAVLFVGLTQGPQMAAIFAAFGALPLLQKIAWAVMVIVPLVMLPFAVWLWDRLMRQQQSGTVLQQRLDGVRTSVKEGIKDQAGVEADVQRLTRSDPEDAIAALQRRVSEAERFAQIQQSRNAITDLDSRVAAIRAQQQALKERLAPVLDVRHSIEQQFAELDGRQGDIERSLAEIASGDDGTALEIRLKNLSEFVRLGNERCDQIEQASKTLASLSEAGAEMGIRLAPLAAAEDGISSRVRRVGETNDRLSAQIASLERLPEGLLSDRVQKLSTNSKKLGEGIAHLHDEFASLADLQKAVAGFVAAFERALGALSNAKDIHGAPDVDARIAEVTQFIGQTQNRLDDIERRVMVFADLKARLTDLQMRLAPLESPDNGVVKLIGDLQGIREKLVEKIRNIEGGEAGDLAARVKTFADTKRDLEQRVSNLTDQFTRLSTIRKDIAGLFDKLSSAVNGSAN